MSNHKRDARSWQPSIEMIRVRRVVADAFGVSELEILSPRRLDRVAHARQAVAFVLRAVWPGLSYPCIARICARNDHSTMIHAVRTVGDRVARDPVLADKITALINLCRSDLGQKQHDAHVRAHALHRLAHIAEAAAERRAAIDAALLVRPSGADCEVIARGVEALSAGRKVRPVNVLSPDDSDALRRAVGADALGKAIAAAGGWPSARPKVAA